MEKTERISNAVPTDGMRAWLESGDQSGRVGEYAVFRIEPVTYFCHAERVQVIYAKRVFGSEGAISAPLTLDSAFDCCGMYHSGDGRILWTGLEREALVEIDRSFDGACWDRFDARCSEEVASFLFGEDADVARVEGARWETPATEGSVAGHYVRTGGFGYPVPAADRTFSGRDAMGCSWKKMVIFSDWDLAVDYAMELWKQENEHRIGPIREAFSEWNSFVDANRSRIASSMSANIEILTALDRVPDRAKNVRLSFANGRETVEVTEDVARLSCALSYPAGLAFRVPVGRPNMSRLAKAGIPEGEIARSFAGVKYGGKWIYEARRA